MWRQLMVDQALLERLRRATFGALLRQSLTMFATMGVIAVFLIVTSWSSWGMYALLFAVLPLAGVFNLWQAAGRVARFYPVGSYIAYAVTPDGSLHSSNVLSTCVQNPGTILRLTTSGDCWILIAATGGILPIPLELIPDADAALLVRHLPARTRPASIGRP